MAGKTEPGVWTQLAREMLRQQQLAVPRRIERAGIHPTLLSSAVLAALAMSTSAVATVTCTASSCTFTSTGETNTSAIITTSSFGFESNSYGSTNTQSGNISGSGSVSVSGSVYPGSTLILSGVNTYTGGTFVNGNSSLQIGTVSTTGTLPGNVIFTDTTFNGYEAGSLTLINTVGAGGSSYSGTIVHAGAVNLAGTTTLGSATVDGSSSVSGEGNGKFTLTDSANAGSSTVTNISQLTMSGTSTLDSSTVTNVADLEVDGSATTGNSTISGYATAVFASNTTAGRSTLTGASSGSQVEFLDQSSAQTATINNDSAAGAGAALFFNGSATAASSTINNGSASDVMEANTIAAPGRNTVEFWSDATAGNATINNYNGYVLFDYTSTADNAQINNHNGGIIDFFTYASAGTAHILNDSGSSITLEGASTADQATIVNQATANVDISQNTNTSVAIGNISGAGDVYLGSNTLVVGSNNGDDSIGALHDSYGPAFADLGVTAETGGSLLKEGTGTLVLSGNSDYTGGTTIAAGTLQVGTGGTTGAILGTVADSGSLVFERSDSYDFTGAVSGSGSLTQAGTGTLMLSGTNTYTGGTSIASGTLQLGDGGASGSVVGAIADGGNLSIDRSDTYVLGNAVSGSGRLTQVGSGTTVINTTQGYTGGTTITAGTLQLGDGGTAGAVSGAIVDNANLSLDFAGTYTLANAISGSGGVSQVSSGTLVIDDSETYTGGTYINVGTVQIGTGGTSGSIVGNVADNGRLVFDRNDNYDFAGAISGSGSVTQAGSGVLVVSGDNSYTGGTTISSGTLQLGDGGASGGVVGAIADSGNLSIDRSDTYVLGNAVSGSGSLTQAGSGTTVINTALAYTGGTTITGGTLQLGDGGTTGAVSGAIVDNANLSLDFAGTYTLANAVSGSGSVSQVSSGTLVIDDSESYTGGTHINVGTVQIGTGGTSGSIVGNVDDNGRLVFDRNDNYDFAGAISGSGSVTQAGSGVLVVSGDNSYTGGTIIATGELEITDGGYVPGAVSNNGTLAFDSSGASTFDGSLSGSGAVIQQGSGTLTWNGTSTDTGTTTLNAGGLVLGDASHGSANLGGDLQQAAGTTLSGFGTIDGNADLDGVIAPGDSSTVGSLHIKGNLVLGADSQLQAKVLPDGNNDELVVSGSAKLNGAVLALLQNQSYQANTAYTLVDAQQGISGEFGSVSANFAFVDPTLRYTADSAVLTLLRNAIAFQDVGITLNQINTGRAIGSLSTDNGIYQAVEVSSAEQARADYNQLSGEIHASVLSSVLQNSLAIEDTINQQVFSPAGTELNGDRSSERTWVQALGGGGSFNANAQVGTAATHDTSSGVIGGADMAVADNADVGVLAGTQVSSLCDSARDSTASIHNRFVGAYAGGRDGSLVANGGIVYGENSIQTARRLQTPAIAQTLDANYHAPLLQAFAQTGWAISLGQGVAMPYLNATVAHVGADRFSESGGDGALSAGNQVQTARLSTLGVQGQWAVAEQGGEATLHVNANFGWQHAYGGVTPRRSLNFVAGGDAFDIYGNAIARNAAVASVGAGVRLSKRASLDLRLSERSGGGVRDANASATLTIAI
jgi:fibronectin-binding autotransporter adhesin